MSKKENICKGCRSYKLPNNNSKVKIRGCAIEIPFISNNVKCPCLDCIIKMICNDMCDRFNAYAKTSRTRNTFEKRIKAK